MPMRLFISVIFLIISACLHAQNEPVVSKDSLTISNEQLMQTLKMFKELNTKGIDRIKDSIIVSEEFNQILKNEEYRKILYPETYTWEQAIIFIQKTELKKAFWYLINLYPTSDKNKELVIKSIITYDAIFRMDEVLINTFYTYAYTDPEVSTIVDNLPEIERPDILEKKLNTVRELVIYIHKYREQRNSSGQ